MKKAYAKTAKEFDRRFDADEDVSDLVEPDKIRAIQPDLEIKRTTLDLPAHLLEKLDREAALRGITRQSLIKVWLYERLETKPRSGSSLGSI